VIVSNLEGVLVHQVERVPGELGATTGVTANQISILVAYTIISHEPKNIKKIPGSTYG
jgi:hypothetical protein